MSFKDENEFRMKGVQILSRSGRLCRLGLSRSCATQNANANPEAASSIVVPVRKLYTFENSKTGKGPEL